MKKSIADKNAATDSKQQKDLITLFMDTMDSTAAVMEIRDAVITSLAGKDTTSFSMSWMIVNMNRYPRVLDKIRAEINANLPELMSGELEAPSMSDLQKLPYLEAAMRESLRLVWGEDAAEFRPERWIDEDGKVIKMPPFKFFSFLAGPHQCLGMRFALLEMQTVMAVLLSRFDIKTVENPFDITYDYSVVIPVKGPLMANIHDPRLRLLVVRFQCFSSIGD
ncbi:Cytochrome P450, E-class, group I [Phytophthora cactorum]|nr:Cytochrome P450, E-class, group I [Phytophthora cactorum]